MNILYIDHYAGSPKMGMEFRPFYFAKEWSKSGNNVRIIGASFSHLRKTNPDVKKDFLCETIDGVEYQWIKTCKYKGNGLKRVLSIYQFVSKLKRNAKYICDSFKPDVVIASSTYPFDAYAGKKIAKISNAKFIFEGHDLWPLTLIEIGGMNPKNPFIIKMAKAEKYAYSQSDTVVSLLPFSYEHMLRHGLQSIEKFHYISNGIVVSDWDAPENLPLEHQKLFTQLKKSNKFIVMFTGGHAVSNMLDVLLNVAKQLINDDSIVFVLIGSGVEKARLIQRKEKENLNNVVFLPPINKNAIPSALNEASVLYIGGYAQLYRFGVSMNKVYDYMMSGKPILYGVKAKNNDVEEAGAGVVFDFNDINSLVNAIYKVKNMSENDRKIMGEKGKQWVIKNCDYRVLAQRFLLLMD